MPNIVYALTNAAMPGIVKIGMTDRDDVRRRMSDLYTTGVPLPFDCVVAREIDGREALEIENALHTAFGPNRVNSSREFFQIDPEQVQALLRVMPGRDVTPKTPELDAGAQDEDQAAADEYKKRQARTNELEFMESLNEHGMIAYRRVLALGDQEGMRIRWGTKGFSLNVVSDGAHVPAYFGYPPSAYNQQIYKRMLQSGALTGARKAVLEKLYLSLNPLRLSRQIEAETEELLRLAWRRGEPPIMVTLPVTAVLRSHPWLGNH